MPLSDMTPGQQESITSLVMQMADAIATATPSLNPDAQKVMDFQKTMLGGIMLAIRTLYGKETADAMVGALKLAVKQRHGVDFDMAPSVFDSAAETGAFKEWIYMDRTWNPPGEA